MSNRYRILLRSVMLVAIVLAYLCSGAAPASASTVYASGMGFENGLAGWEVLGGGVSVTTTYQLPNGSYVNPQFDSHEGVLHGGGATIDEVAQFLHLDVAQFETFATGYGASLDGSTVGCAIRQTVTRTGDSGALVPFSVFWNTTASSGYGGFAGVSAVYDLEDHSSVTGGVSNASRDHWFAANDYLMSGPGTYTIGFFNFSLPGQSTMILDGLDAYVPPANVPEPSSVMLLLGLGVSGLAALKRKATV